MDTTIEITPVIITEQYELISGFMHLLHLHEHSLNDKTAAWQDIEASYMRHVIKMQEESDGLCLVAYVNKVPSGFIFGYVEEQDDSRIEIHEGKELYVSDGFVKEENRRMGVYRMLNAYLEQHFINKGITRIIRFTLVNNTNMRQFLEEESYSVTRLLYEKWLY
jgi:GNAT superfamily N-acetyltransferase